MGDTSSGLSGPRILELASDAAVERIRAESLDALAAVRRLAGWGELGELQPALRAAGETVDTVAVLARLELERRLERRLAAARGIGPR